MKKGTEDQSSDLQMKTIHGLLSSIGKDLNIPSSTEGVTLSSHKNDRIVSKVSSHAGASKGGKRTGKTISMTTAVKANANANATTKTNKEIKEHATVMSIPYYSTILLSTSDTLSVAIENQNTAANTEIHANPHHQHHHCSIKHHSSEATLSGSKLSLTNEQLILIPAASTIPTSSSSPSDKHHQHHSNDKTNANVLYYNDTIVLLNTVNEKALGVNMNQNDKIGFWRSVIGTAEQWTIVPLFHDDNDDDDDDHNNVRDGKKNENCIVKSNDQILLKNELNGKFLSFAPYDNDNHNDKYNTKNKKLHHYPSLCLQGLVWNDPPKKDEDDDDDHDGVRKQLLQTKTVQHTKHQIFHLIKVNTPPCPTWLHTRPYLNATYLSYSNRHGLFCNDNSTTPLWTLDVSIQDSMLVEEILDALIGLEGENIIISNNQNIKNTHQLHNTHFILKDKSNFDPNIRYFVEKIIPTASEYIQINSFISKRLVEYEYGTISHALCGAMDVLVKEYMDFIESLHELYRHQEPSPSITLNSLYGELQHSIRTIRIIHRIVQEVQFCKGGALLNRMENLLQMEFLGDQRAKIIFCYLYEHSAIPYMEMLSGWVEDGSLNDPYEEFMIEERKKIPGVALLNNVIDPMEEDSLSWKSWYILRDEHVLNVLKTHDTEFSGKNNNNDRSIGSGLVQKILTTGKYWNAIASCHHRDKRAVQLVTRSPRGVLESNRVEAPSLTYGMVSVELEKYINHEYSMASRTLFNIVMRDYQTREVLAFMKRYFLLDQGDFFVHFLDMAEDELLQEMSDISRSRVHNWMTMSIQMSGGTASGESVTESLIFDFVSSLKAEFATQSLINHLDALHDFEGGIKTYEVKTPSRHMYGGANKGLTGVEAFMLDFTKMPFPLSLILSRSTIRNYQLMFRHLFFAKHVERRLVGTWLDHQMIKEYTSLRKDLGQTYCLRQRMLHFMQNFVYYMMFEVIEPNFLHMESQLLGQTRKSEDRFEFSTEKVPVNTQTVDDVLRIHNDFVQNTLKECLLTNRDLIRTLTKLMTTCLLFSDQMKLFMEATKIDEEQSSIATEARQKRTRNMYETAGPIMNEKKEKKIREALMALGQQRKARKQKQIAMLQRELSTESYKNMISRFEQVFNSNLSEFMTQLMKDSEGRYHSHLSNLCVRLDYNGYVTRSMGKNRGH